jgi:hypothetical protein
MKILILCPGKIAAAPDKIKCFTDVLNYYLPQALSDKADITVISIPDTDGDQLKKVFSTLDVDGYNAIITLGLRFYSKISPETTALLRDRFSGLFCQVHDGSRLDNDPVDITFTFKNDDDRLKGNPGWYARHKQYNEYMGWATDPEINRPQQDPRDLRILVDHTNYGNNEVDHTVQILQQIARFIKSEQWKRKFDSVTVRRFDSGRVVDVDFKHLDTIQRYDRTPIPFTEITQEHCKAHLFFVTHPESVGLVVLETAMAGALPVVPHNFVPVDRLKTVRHVVYNGKINWPRVLSKIDVEKSREVALTNTWSAMAEKIVEALTQRLAQRTQS